MLRRIQFPESKIGTQASNFDCIKPPLRLRDFVASTSHPSFGIQASNFGRIKPPRHLSRIHLASKLRNPSSNFGRIKPPRRLRRIYLASKLQNPSFELRSHQTSTPASSHPPRIQASNRSIFDVLYTFVRNDGLYEHAFSLGARFHLVRAPGAARSHLVRAPALTRRSRSAPPL